MRYNRKIREISKKEKYNDNDIENAFYVHTLL